MAPGSPEARGLEVHPALPELSGGWAALSDLAAGKAPQTAVVRDLQALASSNVCWSADDMLFRTDRTADLCKALGRAASLIETKAAFEKQGGGFLLPSSTKTTTVDVRRGFVPSFDGYADMSYCWNMRRQPSNTSGFRRVPGVAVLLTEHHGNSNIGHASRDAGFFAFLLHEEQVTRNSGNSTLPVSMVFVKDHQYGHMVRAGKRALPFRMESLRALMQGSVPDGRIAYLGDHEANETLLSMFDNRTEGGVCFDVAIQRLRMGYFDHGMYRAKAWAYCGVDGSQPADTFLIEAHGKGDKKVGMRRWRDVDRMASFVRNHSAAAGLDIRVESFDSGWTFCDQVRLYARSKVALHHHGAAVAGNGAFIRPDSVLVELEGVNCFTGGQENPQWDECKGGIGNTLNYQFAHTQGLRYVGGKVVVPVPTKAKPCPATPMYFYREDCVLDIQYDALDAVLRKVRELLEVPYTGTPVPSMVPSTSSISSAAVAARPLEVAALPPLVGISGPGPDWLSQAKGALPLLVGAQLLPLCWYCFGRRRCAAKRAAASADGARPSAAPCPNGAAAGTSHRSVAAQVYGGEA